MLDTELKDECSRRVSGGEVRNGKLVKMSMQSLFRERDTRAYLRSGKHMVEAWQGHMSVLLVTGPKKIWTLSHVPIISVITSGCAVDRRFNCAQRTEAGQIWH